MAAPDLIEPCVRNPRLVAQIVDGLAQAEAAHDASGRAARVFKDFMTKVKPAKGATK